MGTLVDLIGTVALAVFIVTALVEASMRTATPSTKSWPSHAAKTHAPSTSSSKSGR